MKILLKGYYGFGNLGDDILLSVAYGIINNKFPNAEIFVFSNYSKNTISSNYIGDFNSYIFKITSNEIKLIDWTYDGSFDIIVNGGGGVYFDNSNGSIFRKAINPLAIKALGVHGIFTLEKLIRKLFQRPSRIKFNKRLGIGIGIGEFNPQSKFFVDKMSELGGYNYMWVRDSHSYKSLNKYKFKKRIEKGTDLAFLTKFWIQENIIKGFIEKKSNIIAVLLMDNPKYNERLFGLIHKFEKKIRSSNLEIRYFSFDQIYDKNYTETFKSSIDVWNPHQQSFQDFLEKFAECKVLITARAHGAILGSCFRMIPLCLNISKKLEQISLMFPNSSELIPINITETELFDKVIEKLNNYSKISLSLKKDVIANTELAEENLISFISELKSSERS